MDIDKNLSNSNFFIFGVICLVCCIAFFLFSAFILPFMIWNLSYSVPDFVIYLISYFEDHYNYTEAQSRFWVWLIFFIPAIITGLISYFISHRIDNEVLGIEPENEEEDTEEQKLQAEQKRQELKDSAALGFKILFLMATIVAAILLLQFII